MRLSLVLLGLYFAFIFVFAIIINAIIVLYDNRGENCVPSYDYIEGATRTNFLRSFDLSWTTLSTVGYGVVSTTADDACLGLRYLLAIEGFNGIVFSGFCGGMFFLKISRLQSRAYATFSSCLCLQFGRDVPDRDLLRVESMHHTRFSTTRTQSQYNHDETVRSNNNSFPGLTFRLLNSQGAIGGEIVDASIKCMVVSVDDSSNSDENTDASDRVSIEAEQVNGGVNASQVSNTIKKRIYCRLQVTPDVNPFFAGGVWCVRHVLNEKSALLKASVRHRIAETGHWPSDMNSYSKIRDCISNKVQEIIVIFNGTSNLTAESVFKSVTYKPQDIYVGWQFARMHYLRDSGKSGFDIQVDPDLLHDIVPQEEGGCEPLGKDRAE